MTEPVVGWPYYKSENHIRDCLDQNRMSYIPRTFMLLAGSFALAAANVIVVLGLGSEYDEEAVLAFLVVEALIVAGLDVVRVLIRIYAKATGAKWIVAEPWVKVFFSLPLIALGALVVAASLGRGPGIGASAVQGVAILREEATYVAIPIALVGLYHIGWLIGSMLDRRRTGHAGIAAHSGGWAFFSIVMMLVILLTYGNALQTAMYALIGTKVFGQALVLWSTPISAAMGKSKKKK